MKNEKFVSDIEMFIRSAKLGYLSIEDCREYILTHIKNNGYPKYFHVMSFELGISAGILIMFICKYFKLF